MTSDESIVCFFSHLYSESQFAVSFVQEFAIALAENAVDNGVELRIRREVMAIKSIKDNSLWELTVRHWEPQEYVQSLQKTRGKKMIVAVVVLLAVGMVAAGAMFAATNDTSDQGNQSIAAVVTAVLIGTAVTLYATYITNLVSRRPVLDMTLLVKRAGRAVGLNGGKPVGVDDMLVGGSGSCHVQKGVTVKLETVRAQYVVNCAGGASDQIARMIGDESFRIKPRLGDYILLNRNQVRVLLWFRLTAVTV